MDNNKTNERAQKAQQKATMVVVALGILGVLLIAMMLPKDHIGKLIKEDAKFKYATSITSNTNARQKADVYLCEGMTVIEASEYIKNQLKKPKKMNTLEDNLAVQMVYDDHDVLVYKGEDEQTMVQVAEEEFVRTNGYGHVYHSNPFLTMMMLDNLSRTYKPNTSGTTGGGSVRSESAGSRTYTGGGTDFGK